MLRYLAAAWGILGVVAFLCKAIVPMTMLAIDAVHKYDLSLLQWTLLILNVVFMAYFEGYKGFQQGFSRRAAARVLYLSKQATYVNGLLAPLFCIGYFGSNTKRQITTIVITLMIVLVIIVVRQFPQPWRGIVDAGVVTGLMWGVVSMLVYSWLAFSKNEFPHDPELSIRYSINVDK